MEKTQQLISTLTQELLEKLTIPGTVSVAEKDGAMWVTVETEERGVLIGHHGKSLEALQILLGQLIYKKLGTWVRLVMTVGDYRERRERELKEIVAQIAQRVAQSGQAEALPYLTPAERRLIHMEIAANHPEVISQSEGEGKYRQLMIKPKA